MRYLDMIHQLGGEVTAYDISLKKIEYNTNDYSTAKRFAIADKLVSLLWEKATEVIPAFSPLFNQAELVINYSPDLIHQTKLIQIFVGVKYGEGSGRFAPVDKLEDFVNFLDPYLPDNNPFPIQEFGIAG